eukprot:GHVU01128137.1.p1 GENE.GHVU01128137.1~~GHVU01128137.1.p1  ORF type:complete len:212 (+),score=36.22 GHVU01128137.1:77-712(+)
MEIGIDEIGDGGAVNEAQLLIALKKYLVENKENDNKRYSIIPPEGHANESLFDFTDFRFTEPLIFCFVCFHVTLLLIVILYRRRYTIQAVLFVAIVALVSVSKPLNRLGSTNWELIAHNNYFDSEGIFIGCFWAGPLLLIGFIQLIFSLAWAAELLVVVKRRELVQGRRGGAATAAAASTSVAGRAAAAATDGEGASAASNVNVEAAPTKQ